MATVIGKTKAEHDMKHMQKQSGKSANIRPAVDVDAVRKEYLANENDNYHAENAMLLAKHFGTKKEYEAAEKSMQYRDKKGGYRSDDPVAMEHHKNSHAMHTKYGEHIREGYESKKDEKKELPY